MVKLASVREFRLYGPSLSKHIFECVGASIYVLAAILLLVGFVFQLPWFDSRPGLIILMVALLLIIAVNLHDLFAHLAGIDFRLPIIKLDWQLGLVELATPFVQTIGAILSFVGLLLLFLQTSRGESFHHKYWKHATNLLVAGPAFWVLGSIHNAFQVYERANAQLQAMQKAVYLPFLIGSILYLISSIVNLERTSKRNSRHKVTATWLAILGSGVLVLGGLVNLVKVLKEQQTNGHLEKLRGGAHERLVREREGRRPLLSEEHMRKRQAAAEIEGLPTGGQPYKEALIRS
eukprot:Gb_02049 [translate_table: standard]